MGVEGQRVFIVGAGNELLGDEGLGVHVARSLRALEPGLPAGVEVLEAGTALFDVLPQISRCTRLILIDAIRMGGEPGTVYRAELEGDLDERAETPPQLSLHQSNLLETLAAVRLLGLLPERITLLGAEPQSVDLALGLSPALAQAAAQIVSLLTDEIGDKVEVRAAAAPNPPS